MRVLVVTAVRAELDAAGVTGLVGGVGPVAAAVSTAMALAANEYDLVVSAGLAGGFSGRAPIGSVVVASTVRWADLGAATDEGFLDLSGLGLAGGDALASTGGRWVTDTLGAAGVPALTGEILTLSTMTGTDRRGDELAAVHPSAVAEAMEGYGVAWAARAAGVRWAEVRAVSNVIGRRDRSAWDIPAAFEALRTAVTALT
ncbi:futalosine hydrolase [Cryptosporangium arvum]|uniref:Futalosine hydrolase n=1 Tax=Cryptosporangium arvum DSM 44712 TaxID=927661 RepID=A0A010ZLH1_9ACTN|nr:futalosine hydrolase [Cryptosporangium arvum]EXG79519.1 futalosine hydrolase [Cryptosporangium arvum DSM 44712]